MSTALANLEAQENSDENHLFVLNRQNGPPKILFSLHAPGPYASLSPVLHQLVDRQLSVACISSGENGGIDSRIRNDFSNDYQENPFDLSTNLNPDLFVVSFDPQQKRLISIIEKTLAKSNPALVVIEDYPGDCRQILEEMLQKGIMPEHVLVPVTDQQESYKILYPNLSITTVGNPAFDRILPWKEEDSAQIKELFNTTPDSVVVSYIGLPTQDFPRTGFGIEVAGITTWDSLESFALQQLIKLMHSVAQLRPENHFTFIYKPHPRDNSDLMPIVNIKHPENLQVISGSQQYWETHNIQPSKIAQFSHIVFAVMSTVLDEIAIRNSLSGTTFPLPASLIPKGFSPGYMNPDPNSVFHRINFSTLPIVTNHASRLIESPDDLYRVVYDILLGRHEWLEQMKKHQEIFAQKYLFPHPDATNRIFSVINGYL